VVDCRHRRLQRRRHQRHSVARHQWRHRHLVHERRADFAGGRIGNVPNVWSVAETGDFNGDGKSDILWHDTSGDVGVWLMNGSQISTATAIVTAPTVWSIQSVGADSTKLPCENAPNWRRGLIRSRRQFVQNRTRNGRRTKMKSRAEMPCWDFRAKLARVSF